MVTVSDSVEAYICILRKMFADGIVNFGRIYVLSVYTKDVCAKYPEIKQSLIAIYLWFVNSVPYEQKSSCMKDIK